MKPSLGICKALLKYGYANFSLEILEYCDLEVLISREQFYLDTFNPEYNILKKAGNLLGFNHSEESRLRLVRLKVLLSLYILHSMSYFILFLLY